MFRKYGGLVGCCVWEGREPTEEETEDGIVDCINDDESLGLVLPNNELRKLAYIIFVRLWMGVLGKGRRVELPDCVKTGVHGMYPIPDGTYMGHRYQ